MFWRPLGSVMSGVTRAALQCWRVPGRDPSCPPHHQIILLLAGLFSWSSPGRCCFSLGAPFHPPLQRAGALRQPDLRASRRKRPGGRRKRADGRCCRGRDLGEVRRLLLGGERAAATGGLQQPGVLLPLQPAGGFPHQQGHCVPADQQSGAGLSAWRRGDQRRSVSTRSGTNQNGEGGRRRDEGANARGGGGDIQGGAAWMTAVRMAWCVKRNALVTGRSNKSWDCLIQKKQKCHFLLEA